MQSNKCQLKHLPETVFNKLQVHPLITSCSAAECRFIVARLQGNSTGEERAEGVVVVLDV